MFCKLLYSVYIYITCASHPVIYMSYHHAHAATTAHRWVVCRICRQGPEAADQCHPRPPECCYIQRLPHTQHCKPWNPPRPHASLYRPVEKAQLTTLWANVAFGTLKMEEWGSQHTFSISGLTYFSKAAAEESAGMSTRWRDSCPDSKYEQIPLFSISLWDADRFRDSGMNPVSLSLPQTERTRCDTACTICPWGTSACGTGLFFLANNKPFSVISKCIHNLMTKHSQH